MYGWLFNIKRYMHSDMWGWKNYERETFPYLLWRRESQIKWWVQWHLPNRSRFHLCGWIINLERLMQGDLWRWPQFRVSSLWRWKLIRWRWVSVSSDLKSYSCSSQCTIEIGYDCSGGSPTKADTCNELCGDGIIMNRPNSTYCDDGNLDSGDGCNQSCSVETGYACAGGDST